MSNTPEYPQKLNQLDRYTEFCPNDSNILLFNGKPEKEIHEGFHNAYCRKCHVYFKIPPKDIK